MKRVVSACLAGFLCIALLFGGNLGEVFPTATSVYAETQSGITVVKQTKKIYRGNTASVTIQGEPGVKYSIKVYYSTKASTAKGLTTKKRMRMAL